MKSLKEWQDDQEEQEEINEMTGTPMDVVQQTMARIAPMIAHAYQQIEAWPNERQKTAARRTLDSQMRKASRDQWMGKARQASTQMGRGMDASRAMKRFGGMGQAAANQLAASVESTPVDND